MGFEKLYRKYYPELYRFAFQLTLSVEDCEDFVQETFTRLFKELKKNTILNSPRAWLYKVLLNLIRKDYKKKLQMKNIIINIGYENPTSPDLQDNYIKDEKQALVFWALNQINEKDRNLLILYHDGLSYTEMAEILDLNLISIGTLISRAIQKLKKNLQNKHHQLFE